MSSINITVQNYNSTAEGFNIDRYPNECPYCHLTIHPRFDRGAFNSQTRVLELLFFCTNYNCNRLFIAFYLKSEDVGGVYDLSSVTFGNPMSQDFSENVRMISPLFVKIFNQSYLAEQQGLIDICGAGYRKSLEFLIKDYLIQKDKSREDIIKKKFLGNCINEDIDNANIKTVAARAAWLGNDETHYEKKWDDKDLTNLKDLIQLTVNWIENEILTEKYKTSMPEK